MSVVFELFLEILLNVIGGLLEAWIGDFSWPDTTASRIFWCIILASLGGVIWWELR